MAIKRYIASADSTITNAYKSNLSTRGTGSNMGLADILETFTIYGQANSASLEKARVLVNFPVSTITTDRSAGTIPASGSVSFYLRLFNAEHGQTLPRNATLEIKAVLNSSWEEGFGLDMDGYTDATRDSTGVNWISANGNIAAATLVDAIDVSSIAQNDKFTMTVPTSAGGDGVTYTFLFDSSTDVESDEEANTFGIANWSDDADAASILRDAINGVQNAKYKYGANNLDLTPVVAAGTIGLTAAVGTSSSKITLTMDTKGAGGNVAGVLVAVVRFNGDKILESSFTGGDGPWTTAGGDYVNPDVDLSSSFTQTLTEGDEDIEVDITTLAEQWLNSAGNVLDSKNTYGVGVMFSSSHESATRSFYTKKFFARSSEFFFKRPALEARWDSSKKDDRAKVYYSSSLVSGEDNLNTVYLYNYVRGQLRDLPHDSLKNTSDTVYVSFFSGNAINTEPNSIPLNLPAGGGVASANDRNVTGSRVSTGIYKARFALTSAKTPVGTIYDVWHNARSLDGGGADHLDFGEIQFKTGSLKPRRIASYDIAPTDAYVTSITNLRKSYGTDETTRLRLYTRPKDWNPTVYTVSTSEADSVTIDSGSYRVFRVIDNYETIGYGTGSDLHTMMSYDLSGNYLDLDMSLLEPDYMYGIKFAYYNGSVGDWVEQPEVFKFRVE
jgi:hypothetical protein